MWKNELYDERNRDEKNINYFYVNYNTFNKL